MSISAIFTILANSKNETSSMERQTQHVLGFVQVHMGIDWAILGVVRVARGIVRLFQGVVSGIGRLSTICLDMSYYF